MRSPNHTGVRWCILQGIAGHLVENPIIKLAVSRYKIRNPYRGLPTGVMTSLNDRNLQQGNIGRETRFKKLVNKKKCMYSLSGSLSLDISE